MLRTERRDYPRIAIRLMIDAIGHTLDMSAGGVRVLIADPMAEGTKPVLSFTLPDDPEPIMCRSRIVWCRPSKIAPELFEAGVSFSDITGEDRNRIVAFGQKTC